MSFVKRCLHDGMMCDNMGGCKPNYCERKTCGLKHPNPWSYVDKYEYQVELLWNGDNNTLRELFIMCSGLGGELGEVGELLESTSDFTIRVGQRKAFLLELGDILYYLTKICHVRGYTLPNMSKMYPLPEMTTPNVIPIPHMFIKLCCYSGDILEMLKKNVRDGRPIIEKDFLKSICEVVKTMIWMAWTQDSSLKEIMEMNMAKIEKKWKSRV